MQLVVGASVTNARSLFGSNAEISAPPTLARPMGSRFSGAANPAAGAKAIKDAARAAQASTRVPDLCIRLPPDRIPRTVIVMEPVRPACNVLLTSYPRAAPGA